MNLTNLSLNASDQSIKRGFEQGFKQGVEKYQSLLIVLAASYAIHLCFFLIIDLWFDEEKYDIQYMKGSLNIFFLIVRIGIFISLVTGKLLYFNF